MLLKMYLLMHVRRLNEIVFVQIIALNNLSENYAFCFAPSSFLHNTFLLYLFQRQIHQW